LSLLREDTFLNRALIIAALALIAPSVVAIASAQDNPSGYLNPTDVCVRYPLLDRLDCQTCISQGQPAARCEAEAFLGEGPLRTMMKGQRTPAVIQQFPLTDAARTENATPQPMAFPTIVPFNPQVWALAPPSQNPGPVQPQQVVPGPETQKDVFTWCKAINTASGIAESTLMVKDIAGTLGLSAGEAETVAESARVAASSRSLLFLIAAGTAVYVVTEQCKPDAR